MKERRARLAPRRKAVRPAWQAARYRGRHAAWRGGAWIWGVRAVCMLAVAVVLLCILAWAAAEERAAEADKAADSGAANMRSAAGGLNAGSGLPSGDDLQAGGLLNAACLAGVEGAARAADSQAVDNLQADDNLPAADLPAAGNEGSAITAAQPAHTATLTATAYCPCVQCCGVWSAQHPSRAGTGYVQRTASGTIPKQGRTVGVDPAVIPLGSHVWIDGHEYIAEDTGNRRGAWVDLYCDSHEDALQWGVRTVEVRW